jgi:putative oxidoreductase
MKSILNFNFFVRIIIAAILTQTLYFKFTASEESVYIFEKVGMEPWGRIASGIVELIAAVLLLFRKTAWMGAILALGTISGAIFFHLTRLGIEVKDDGGLLFILACGVFLGSLYILYTAYLDYKKRPVAPSV